ncbi:MAG: hypothetical protein KF708_03230 [Pirellulales bacterium]|nr:hypothetical protein [Pirellulales bacterium]
MPYFEAGRSWGAASSRVCGLIGFVIACLLAQQPAKATLVTFTSLYETAPDGFTSFSSNPSLNNHGQIAFVASGPGGAPRTLYVGTGGPTTTIAALGATFSQLSNSADINDAGNVLFKAQQTSGVQGAYVGNGGPLMTVIDTDGPIAPPFLNDFGVPDLNNVGSVVFRGALDAGGSAMFVGNGGPPVPVFSGTQNGSPTINNANTVAYATSSAVHLWNSGSTTTLISSGAGISSFAGSPDINDSGAVAIAGGIVSGTLAILRVDPFGAATVVADVNGPYAWFDFSPALNNLGTVVFQADLDGGGKGLFTGSDPVADRVIATGDSLFGSQITDFGFSRRGLNDHNQVAFNYWLADGRSGIAVASVLVPEAGTLSIAGWGSIVAGVGLMRWRHRTRRRQIG